MIKIGYYLDWDKGPVLEYFQDLSRDGQRKKAEARLRGDILILAALWPRPLGIKVKILKGHEPLWELVRQYQGIAYRIFFCVTGDKLWLLHALEKKQQKTPLADLKLAYKRMLQIL